ncbi:MAG TPA: hypothetical protein PLZ55_05645 [bacterium]|nr:hypothetical protein [bacterium]
MSLLVKKIERAKWRENEIADGADVPADAITNCLRTKQDALSVWEIRSQSDMHDAVLAIVAQSERKNLEAIDIVLLGKSAVENARLCIKDEPGITVVEHLRNTHRDIVELRFSSLGRIADLIVEEFRKKQVYRFTVGDLKKILNEAIEKGILDKHRLQERVRIALNNGE